jgi:hypothetical protein
MGLLYQSLADDLSHQRLIGYNYILLRYGQIIYPDRQSACLWYQWHFVMNQPAA